MLICTASEHTQDSATVIGFTTQAPFTAPPIGRPNRNYLFAEYVWYALRENLIANHTSPGR